MNKIFEKYLALCSAFGPSGREGEIKDLIKKNAEKYADEITTDTLGNLIVRKKGNGKKIMLSAHMDSIGMVATFIDEKGFIRFSNIGGLSKGDLINIPVRFNNGTFGVVSYEEKVDFKDITSESFYIDIGAKSREEALKMVNVGDFAVFANAPFMQGDIMVGPYMDDRIGVLILLELLEKITNCENDLYFVFSVQEEVGLRGAITASFSIKPDMGIAIDVTDTGDTPEKKHKMAVNLGEGAAIKLMDASLICNKEVIELLEKAAKEADINVQKEILTFGGTDAGAMQKSRCGVLSGGVSVPTRYMHSPCEMVSISDVIGCIKLLETAVKL